MKFLKHIMSRIMMEMPGGPGAGGSSTGSTGQAGVTGGTPPATGSDTGGAAGGDDFFTGTDVQIPEELKPKVSQLIRNRLNEVNTKHSQEKQTLEGQARITSRLAKMVGIDKPELLEAKLEEFEENQRRAQVQALATQMGIHPQILAMMQQTQAQVSQVQAQTFDNQFEASLNTLKSNPLYSDIDSATTKSQIKELVKRGMPLESAYWAVSGPQKMEQVKRETEQRILTEKMGGGSFQPVGGGDSQTGNKLNLTPDEISYCKTRGMDPYEYQASKNFGNLEDYRKAKKDKK